MVITKILARKGHLDLGNNYALNGDKTEERVLTAQVEDSTRAQRFVSLV